MLKVYNVLEELDQTQVAVRCAVYTALLLVVLPCIWCTGQCYVAL